MTPLNAAGIDALAQYIRLNDLGDQHCANHPWDAMGKFADIYRGQARVLLTVYFAGCEAAPVKLVEPETAWTYEDILSREG